MTSPRCIVILGSTGSIGTQALEVVAANPERFSVSAISSGGGNLDLLARQAVALGVEAVGAARGEHDIVAAAIHQVAGEAGRQGFA
ncbi:MAG TPA: 1-deoxy-D-xylulose-5-phosphate reductoisomerase, partial [Dermatophilaceae bacterium]